jgi:triosephosphate isomerase
MNGTSASLPELRAVADGFGGELARKIDAVVCVPATLLTRAAAILDTSAVKTGGEDCHWAVSGAHTGCVSAEMLKDAGASFVIVGHSERRTDNSETSQDVHEKAKAAWRAGLTAIICIGETEGERDRGETLAVLSAQIAQSVPASAGPANTVLAYEPVWAIGTGRTPTSGDVAAAHAHIRAELAALAGEGARQVRLLYGGSVKASNAAELLALDNVDGALVGGASLKAVDFLPIAGTYLGLPG